MQLLQSLRYQYFYDFFKVDKTELNLTKKFLDELNVILTSCS